jgi:hypothetical protein
MNGKNKAQPESLKELQEYLRRRQRENDQRSNTLDHTDRARHEGKASAYGLAADKVRDLIKSFPKREVIAKALHDAGMCNYDYGTWNQVQKSGFECECFERADAVRKALSQV